MTEIVRSLESTPQRHSHPRLRNATRSTPGGAYQPARRVARAELERNLLVAVRNLQWRAHPRICLGLA